MLKRTSTALITLVSLVPFVLGQSPEWGQCGGIGWGGPTTCVAGTTCQEMNPYYSQCLPPSSSFTSPTTTPSGVNPTSPSHSSTPTSTPTTTPAPGNPFVGHNIFLSPFYASEVAAAVPQFTNSATAAKAAKVADIPTFIWLDEIAKVPSLGTYLSAASAQGKSSGTPSLLQIVVYDLPDRDCAADASNGEFTIANNGQANYFNYIDQIVAQIKKFPDVKVVAVIEPDSLANLVTNLGVAECSAAKTTYLACITYAMQQLSTVGVVQYLDAGHAGWLGWPANLQPAAQLFSSLYTSAGSPSGVRGLATNVANYNALALAPMLGTFPAHFIVDQGRSGVQNIRSQWGDWCNVLGAGFGTQPTLNTGSSLIDAIVWVKPGGECDGTSNSSAPRFDPHCALSDATPNAPQTYFETLVEKANPPIA
ncbi:cellulase CEL6B [Rhodocollybia butyracea]|uniref:Glucanase n=1 Tax=Rhodocollybia butyracea TaxID=206335 RepID=A0A9P5PNE7_9AGAR|nr:cellulase CEL6B [Rhodocollybia butyracea]